MVNFQALKRWSAAAVSAAMLACGVLPVQAADEIDMYRLYNPNSGEHFYTKDTNEKDTLTSLGWKYEGTGWTAPSQGDPVYRLYNGNAGDHHYTLSENERKTLIGLGWKDEGIGWYSDPAHTVPVYRQYNPNAKKAGAHNYTTDENEAKQLVAWGWKDEGTGWYALKEGKPAPKPASTAPSGPLHVQGSQLVDANNQPVVLQGFSTFGLNYMPQFVDEGVFRFLKDQMHSDVIRLALYTQESGGYCSGGNQQQLKELIDKGVNYAEKTGQYVIIDWHILSDGNPNTHAAQAAAFFDEMAAKYAGKDHVLYEICNEPNGVDWNQIKAYANNIIPYIRRHDPDAVILVGTPTWSQDVDTAAASPLTGYSNIMYTLHFYAATHKDNIRNKLIQAHSAGLPVFVSEFGISSADGNGALDPASGNAWISLLNQYGISRVGWAISNKDETSALLKPGSGLPLSLGSLSAGGQWFYQTYTGGSAASADAIASQPAVTPSQPSQPAQAAQSAVAASSSTLKAELKKENSWQEGSQTKTQYTLNLSAVSAPVSGWKIALKFSGSVSVANSWNAKTTVQGNTVLVEPADYNAAVSASGLSSAPGLIVASNGAAPAVEIQ